MKIFKKIKKWYNNITNDKRRFLFAIPSVILILILSFQAAYIISEIKITNKILSTLENGNISGDTITAINNFIQTYDNQFLTLGLEIVGIAISVWIGLNIYNIVKRDSIKELEESAYQTKSELETFRNDYIQFNITALENAVIKEDRVNDYFIEHFKSQCSEVLDYKITKNIVFIEKSFERIIENYEADNFIDMKKHLNKLEREIEFIEKDIDLTKCSDIVINIINSYINCRRGDYNYYNGLMYYKTGDDVFTITYLKTAERKYLESINEYNEKNQIVKSYIYNVCGYINHLLLLQTKNPEHGRLAAEYSKKACSDSNDNFIETYYSRYHRNYGVNIENNPDTIILQKDNVEWFKCMNNALLQYKYALKYDKKDIKTLTSITSCILKIFDKFIGIDKDDNEKTYSKLSTSNIDEKLQNMNTQYGFLDSYTNLITTAYNSITAAQINDCNLIDTHYHAIHVYMYLFLIEKNENTKNIYKENGIKEINYCESLISCQCKKTPRAFLFKARNFYYTIGSTENGDNYHNKIN